MRFREIRVVPTQIDAYGDDCVVKQRDEAGISFNKKDESTLPQTKEQAIEAVLQHVEDTDEELLDHCLDRAEKWDDYAGTDEAIPRHGRGYIITMVKEEIADAINYLSFFNYGRGKNVITGCISLLRLIYRHTEELGDDGN